LAGSSSRPPRRSARPSSSTPRSATSGSRTASSGSSSRSAGTPAATAAAPRSRRAAAPRKANGRRKFWNYPRQEYTGLHRWLPSWRFLLGSFLTVMFLGVGAVVAAYAMTDIPDPNEDVKAQTSTIYYADEDGGRGDVMGTFAVQPRQIVEFETLPDYVGNAVVAIEDHSFWDNSGISVEALGRAFLNNIKGGDRQGGSTLTQQYVERYLVGQTTTDYVGKAQEVLLALKIGRERTKPEILGGYLNTIYFGRDSYGIQVAAQSYFGVDAKDLTISQAALLAGIIPSPNNWDPAVDPQRAEQRWNTVLNNMVTYGFLDASERAKQEFPETIEVKKNQKYAGAQGYLLDMVKRELAKEPLLIDEDDLNRKGYQILTTIRKPMQKEIVKAGNSVYSGKLTNGDKPSGRLKVGMATIDPSDGAILALYGGKDFLKDQFNHVSLDAIQAASTFKPFTLVAALEQGIPLSKTFSGRNNLELKSWGDKKVVNFGGVNYPWVSLKYATEQSINSVYAQLNDIVTPEKTVETAKAAGITTPLTANPANVLGTDAVHPLDMASAYATFAAQGVHRDPFIVRQVLNANGTEAYNAQDSSSKRFEPEIMAETSYALQQVVQNGSGKDWVKPLGRPIAGKTGTSNENKSAWFVGYTPQLATVVALSQTPESGKGWEKITPFGFKPSGIKNPEITGSSVPAQLWAAYMGQVFEMPQYSKVVDFPERPNLRPTSTAAPTRTQTAKPTQEPTKTEEPSAKVRVPGALVGALQADAFGALVDAGLTPQVTQAYSETVPKGQVISTDPPGGKRVDRGSVVTIVVSQGPKPKPTNPPQTPDPSPSSTAPASAGGEAGPDKPGGRSGG